MLFYFTFYFLAVGKEFSSNELVDVEVKSGQWIGGSVYSTGTNGRALVICLPFDPWEWLASNFSSQHHPWIMCKGYKNKGNDHQLKML